MIVIHAGPKIQKYDPLGNKTKIKKKNLSVIKYKMTPKLKIRQKYVKSAAIIGEGRMPANSN